MLVGVLDQELSSEKAPPEVYEVGWTVVFNYATLNILWYSYYFKYFTYSYCLNYFNTILHYMSATLLGWSAESII